tara:strand:+ start:58132 stop:58554 length:423 start_codon:yes stop_codon:yes gene_type:complete
MKRYFIIGVLLGMVTLKVYADSTYISSTKSHNHLEANKLWRKFIGCGNPKNSEKLTKACLQETGAYSFSTFEVSKAFEFLSLGLEVTGLKECSIAQKKSVIKSKTNDFLCFKILGNKTSSTGYVYFTRKKDTLKILKIKY